MFWIKSLSKHFKRRNLAQKIFELHAWVKKVQFWQFFQKGLGWPCPVSVASKMDQSILKFLNYKDT